MFNVTNLTLNSDVDLDTFIFVSHESKKEGKYQESIQSSTTPDPGYQWESDDYTIGHKNESKEVSLSPAGDHMASTKA